MSYAEDLAPVLRGLSLKIGAGEKVKTYTLWGVPSVVMFCEACLTRSTGNCAVTAPIVQPNW